MKILREKFRKETINELDLQERTQGKENQKEIEVDTLTQAKKIPEVFQSKMMMRTFYNQTMSSLKIKKTLSLRDKSGLLSQVCYKLIIEE